MNTYRVDSHSLLGLRAGWSQERWNVFADLINAADERYVSVVSVSHVAASDAEVLNPGSPLFAIHRSSGTLLACGPTGRLAASRCR